MQIGQDNSHMRTMNQALVSLVSTRKISDKTAMGVSHDPIELRDLLKKQSTRAGNSALHKMSRPTGRK